MGQNRGDGLYLPETTMAKISFLAGIQNKTCREVARWAILGAAACGRSVCALLARGGLTAICRMPWEKQAPECAIRRPG